MRGGLIGPCAAALAMACSAPTSNAPAPSATPSAVPASAAVPAGAGLLDLVRAGKGASYRITYRFSASGIVDGPPVEQTLYVKGALSRWDLSSPTGDRSSVYFLADGTYLCVAEGQPSCVTLPGTQAAPPNLGMQLQRQVRDTPERFAATPAARRTFAGVEAQCFNVIDTSNSGTYGEGVACYSAQGLPLYSEFKTMSGVSFRMEAASVSTSVSDSDLALPSPPRASP